MGWNDVVIEQFLEGKQPIADTFDRDVLILLDTIGAQTRLRRPSPAACLADGSRLLVVARFGEYQGKTDRVIPVVALQPHR